MEKRKELMEFLHERVFDPILNSPNASVSAKRGVRFTIQQMERLDAAGMVHYFWSAIVGTEDSINFANLLAQEHLPRLEDVLEEFRVRFNDKWLEM